jgi:hypothetical protein
MRLTVLMRFDYGCLPASMSFLSNINRRSKLSTIRWCDMSVSHSFEPRFLFVQFAWSGARHSLTGCGIPKQDACIDGALDL